MSKEIVLYKRQAREILSTINKVFVYMFELEQYWIAIH